MVKKEPSFGKLIDEGKSKEEICKLKNLSPEAYEKAHKSLMKIREEKRKAIESQTIEVTIEGRKGLYRMDTERREFKNTENPEDKISFYTDEDILITSFTCQKCGKFIEKLDFKETGTYNLKECEWVSEKTEFSCPHCHTPLNKTPLWMLGVSRIRKWEMDWQIPMFKM